MTLNYPMYDLRTGARRYPGSSTGSGGPTTTYGAPIFTGAEFIHVLKYLKLQGFHVYANKDFGGVNYSAHSPLSWHYLRDSYGNTLAADLGTYGDVNERSRIIKEVIPVLDRIGMAWHYARDGRVPNHYDHLHLDVSNWGRKGGGAYDGFYTTRKKLNPITALSLSGSAAATVTNRAPKRVAAYYGMSGTLVRIIQRIVGASVDGSYGPGTVRAVRAFQKKHGLVQDGNFGPASARAYLNWVGARGPGSSGYSVQLIQWIAGVTADGSYGPGTTKAVKEMQAWGGIAQDGWFGPAARSKLIR